MSKVNTVLGTIPAEELGIVAVHEHIGYGMPGSELDTKWWKTPGAGATRKPCRSCGKFREYGGGTFVDATGICNGRDVDYYKSLSAEDRRAHRRLHRLRRRRHRPAALRPRERGLPREGQFIHEITVGIGDTGAKAGVIKVGVSRGGRMTDLDKRIYRAAARAAVVTGAPILTHLAIDPEPAVNIFNEEGLPLDRVLFGHADDGLNAPITTRDDWIAEQGGRIGFDTFGYDLELPDPPFWGRHAHERLEHFLRLVEQGLRRTSSSSRPTPTAARWAGRA